MIHTENSFNAMLADPRYRDIGSLPSQNVPYKGRADKPSLDKLYIRPFEFAELRLLSAACQTQSKRHLIRAVDLVISHDVNDLTIGDFQYVLTWLRLNSFPTRPYAIEWKCERPLFRHKETRSILSYDQETWPDQKKLIEEYEHSQCDTLNANLVHVKDLETVCLPEDLVLPEGFDFPRVSILEDSDLALQSPDYAYLVPSVQWMVGDTWSERMAYAEANFDKFVAAIDFNKKYVHGVVEQVELKCRTCGSTFTHTMTVDALSFFQ